LKRPYPPERRPGGTRQGVAIVQFPAQKHVQHVPLSAAHADQLFDSGIS